MSQDRPKTLLISLNHGIGVRNVLQTDLFRTLKASDIRIVVLTPNASDPDFQAKYGGNSVSFEPLCLADYQRYLKKWKIQPALKSVRWFTLNGRYDITTISDWYERVHKRDRGAHGLAQILRNLFEDVSIPLLRRSRLLRELLVKLESALFCPDFHAAIFEKYQPDCLLVTSLGFFDFDQYVMREARRHGTKIASMILSWDNTSTRGIGGSFPDHIIAWTDTMKQELIELHDKDAANISVCGAVQFDHYFQDRHALSREYFLDRFGLSPNRKTIYFATKSPTGFPWNPDVVETIAKAIDEDTFPFPCQLLVRLHPIHFRMRDGELLFSDLLQRYDEIARDHDHVTINRPVMQSENIAFDMPESELADVKSILAHSDVMINAFSTMNIEASIFDTPTINVCFESMKVGDQGKARVNVEIDERQTHNQRIVKTGGVRVAGSANEMLEMVSKYLTDPKLDSEGRRSIVERECGPNRGSAGKAVADRILRFMGHHSALGLEPSSSMDGRLTATPESNTRRS